MKQDPTPVSINYTSIPDGYDSSSSRAAEQVPSYPIPPVLPDAGTVKNLWINSFIRSVNWKPHTTGFTIDGKSGYAEFTNVFVSGRIDGSIITGSSFSTTGPNDYSVTINNSEDAVVFSSGATTVATLYSYFIDAGGNGDEGGLIIQTGPGTSGTQAVFAEVLNGSGPLADIAGSGFFSANIQIPVQNSFIALDLGAINYDSSASGYTFFPSLRVTSDYEGIIDFENNNVLVPPRHPRSYLGAGMFPQTPRHAYIDNGSIYFDTQASKLRIIINGVWHWVLTTIDTDFFLSKYDATNIGETLTVVRT